MYIRFAVQLLISADRNEHGLIREHSAQTTTRVVRKRYYNSKRFRY